MHIKRKKSEFFLMGNSRQKSLPLEDYQRFIDDLAKSKGVQANEIREKMANCGLPGLSGVTVIIISLFFHIFLFNKL